ncbi:MAG: hypothetical protein AAGK04_14105 [Planctomycetota bacterium]
MRTMGERARRVWRWIIGVAVIAHAASFFLPVIGPAFFGEFVGWEAAQHSFLVMLDVGWKYPAALRNASQHDWEEFWIPLAWMANVGWPAAWLCLSSRPDARWRRRLGLFVVTAAASLATVGAFADGSWSTGYWTWAVTLVIAFAASWWGPQRSFASEHCQRCGYNLAGVSTCPECGAGSGDTLGYADS